MRKCGRKKNEYQNNVKLKGFENEGADLDSPTPTLEGTTLSESSGSGRTPPPPPQLSRATGRLLGLSLENELGSLKPWSVGLGVEHCESPGSDGGEGEAEGAPPPTR